MNYFKPFYALVAALYLSGCAISHDEPNLLAEQMHKERIALAIKDYDALISAAKTALAKASPAQRPAAALKLAKLYYEARDLPSAEYFARDLSGDEALYLRAQIAQERAQAAECLKLTRQISAKLLARAANLAGICAADLGDYALAKEQFLRAKAALASDEITSNNLAMLALKTNDTAAALGYLRPLYERSKSERVRNNFIIALVRAGKLQEALAVAEAAGMPNARKLIAKLAQSSKSEQGAAGEGGEQGGEQGAGQ